MSHAASIEVPQNGIAGLKHWSFDMRSGFMVAMISLPFSMGIAITSGAPPICGITSAIIAGMVLPFLGGSYVTISGPAAGLAPAIFAGIVLMGTAYMGKGASTEAIMEAGYPLVLVPIFFAGICQMILARLKVAQLCTIFPAAAIEGMLAAIGLLIIVKQLPHFMGQKFAAHDFWEMLAEAPRKAMTMSGENFQVAGLGLGCLALLFILAAIPSKFLKVMPPPVWVFFGGTIVCTFFLRVDRSHLINVPSLLEHGVVLPKFQTVFSNPHMWSETVYLVVLLLMIDGTESLATILAVDKLDPYRRRSSPDKTLEAMGVSNVASSVLGGLTIIPGIVKSTANIMGGGRTQWANFYNACFLLVFLLAARPLINMVPYVVLASILTFVGFKLCRPKVWAHTAHIGMEQLVIFAFTVLVTVTTDLLVGIVAGVAMKLVLNLWYLGLAYRLGNANGGHAPGYVARFISLFRNPVSRREIRDGEYNLYLNGPLVCFNLFHVIRELQHIPNDAKGVNLHFSPLVALVDHTTAETLFHYVEDFNSRQLPMKLVNWELLKPLSHHPAAIQLGLSGELAESIPPHYESNGIPGQVAKQLSGV